MALVFEAISVTVQNFKLRLFSSVWLLDLSFCSSYLTFKKTLRLIAKHSRSSPYDGVLSHQNLGE